jgi:hypothetical protein
MSRAESAYAATPSRRMPPVGPVHPLPEPLHEPRVLAEEKRAEAGLEVHLDRLGATPAEGEAVPEPRQPLVGVDVRDHELVLAELERHGPRGRDGEDGALDADDLHGVQSGTIADGLPPVKVLLPA